MEIDVELKIDFRDCLVDCEKFIKEKETQNVPERNQEEEESESDKKDQFATKQSQQENTPKNATHKEETELSISNQRKAGQSTFSFEAEIK